MRSLTPGRTRRRRGATLIEFVLILPLLMFVALFAVDMGNVILVNGAMQDATYTAARAGAQVGGASLMPNGTYPCGTRSSGSSCSSGASYEAFREAATHVPGYASKQISGARMKVLTGGKCVAQATTARSDNHVTIAVTYQQKLITPGLAILMNWSGADIDDGSWNMEVTASSRCEVVR